MHTNIQKILNDFTNNYKATNEKLLKSIGLHPGQAQVLSVLWIRDGISQADIVRELSVSPPTVNLLVSKLAKAKYVKCKSCKSDKRLMRVFLTKKGNSIRRDAEDKWNELDEIILEGFSDTEKVLVLMLLEKIKNNLQTSEVKQ